MFINHMVETIPLREPITIVTPNAECVKKARKFRSGLQKHFPNSEIKLAVTTTDFAFDFFNNILLKTSEQCLFS